CPACGTARGGSGAGRFPSTALGCPGRSLTPGLAEKPGTCPTAAPEGLFYPCSFQCLEDKDCLGSKKCCPLGCGPACLEPLQGEASCGAGRSRAPCQSPGPCREECEGDSDCPSSQKCCNRLGRSCRSPGFT
uniref:WAP domain-containing protein n=1 Tax=Anser brachyrhynchus TaxID=132585 RepID=A0A8B9BV56_9AVES